MEEKENFCFAFPCHVMSRCSSIYERNEGFERFRRPVHALYMHENENTSINIESTLTLESLRAVLQRILHSLMLF